MDYKSSGVDIDAGHEVVRRIRGLAQGTFTNGVLSDIGSFGGLFHMQAAGATDPVLVASADGVGTKLKVAFMMNRHTTIGEDLVNHCVNDILVQGARPLFFLDYLATGILTPDVAVDIVDGLARACRANGCALLGGETAEMPGFYANREYDLAGFIVGLVERPQVLTGDRIRVGDALIGLPSSGLHTNGYSLARRALADLDWRVHRADLGASIGDALLAVHRSYLSQFRKLGAAGIDPHGIAHITGGGLLENVPRILPQGLAAVFQVGAWPVPPIFALIRQRLGDVARDDLYRAFNMGIGLCVVVAQADAARALAALGEGACVGAIARRTGPAVVLEGG